MTHPAWQPHPIQGWTPDFISSVLKDGLDAGLVDRLMTVSGEVSIATSLALAAKEGIFTGVSGGGTVATALAIAETAPSGSVLLAMVPDTAERYMCVAVPFVRGGGCAARASVDASGRANNTKRPRVRLLRTFCCASSSSHSPSAAPIPPTTPFYDC